MPERASVDCRGCGRRLGLPDGLSEGSTFACAHCGLIARNGPAARAVRWAELDPFVRARGASRINLWGGALGACAWVVVLFFVVAAGWFPLDLALALALPWLALVAGLVRLRAGRPAGVFLGMLWVALGAFMLYTRLLTWLWPGWAGHHLGHEQIQVAPDLLLWFGLLATALGGLAWAGYRFWSRRVPQAAADQTGDRPAGASEKKLRS